MPRISDIREYVFRGGKAVTEVSYDQLIDKLIEARKDESETMWLQASICYYLREFMAVPSATIASDIGVSGRHVTQVAKAHEAFPDESDRAKDMPFSVHMICATTEDPVGWLEKAVENAWSVRQLKEAIKSGKPDPDPVEQAAKLWQKVLDAIEEGGPAAEYLREQVELGVDIIPEASKTQETQAASI